MTLSWLRRVRERRSGAGGTAELRALIGELPESSRRAALTHTSWSGDRIGSYERLALLGDSVLGLAIADELYRSLPGEHAGNLTKILNQTVSGTSCATVGRAIGIPELLLAVEPDTGDGNRTPARLLLEGSRPLPEMTEAMIGACYLEFGFVRTSAAVVAAFREEIERARHQRADFKSALQELAACEGMEVSYRVDSASGPAHDRVYTVTVLVGDAPAGTGEGRSKKAAGQAAAADAMAGRDPHV
ncbi:MAG: putative dsRNA-binding protein [Solirubrobacterales bacterium]|nr:putative dsRNA-binding protein [Solirubrobacterales bacterium]